MSRHNTQLNQPKCRYLASSGRSVLEHSTHNHKIGGSNLSDGIREREREREGYREREREKERERVTEKEREIEKGWLLSQP